MAEMCLTDIPSGWRITKTKYVADLYTGNSISDSDKDNYTDAKNAHPYIATKHVDADLNTVDYDNGLYVKDNDDSFRVAFSGSTLMCIEGGSAGRKKAFLDRDVSFVNKLCCFKPREKIVDKYLYYSLMSPLYEDDFKMRITGLIGGVSVSELKNMILCLPSLLEQQAIVDYLDERCYKIDEIIAEATASIEEHKELRKVVITEAVTMGMGVQGTLKDSGYNWMGYIPSDWNIAPLKHISTKPISYGVIKLFDPDENGVFILRCSDVKAGFIDATNIRTITKELSDEYKRTLLSENDIVINVRGTLGGCAVIPKSMEGYNIAREVALISPDRSKYDSKYIMYYMLSDVFERFRDSSLSGAIYVGINMETLSHFRIAYPSITEQKEISKYLDKKVPDIDALISEKQALIEDLQAYKKSLIYEVVTGKRRVV